jgi:uncharacterized membrane protein YphA (DoxX/SURF4 family)
MIRILQTALPFVLAAFFVVGSFINATASPEIRQDYLSWGYPEWFPYVTAILELTAAMLLLSSKLRRFGAALGAGVTSAAALTLLSQGEFQHAMAPLAVLALSASIVWNGLWKRRGRSHPPEELRGQSDPQERDAG